MTNKIITGTVLAHSVQGGLNFTPEKSHLHHFASYVGELLNQIYGIKKVCGNDLRLRVLQQFKKDVIHESKGENIPDTRSSVPDASTVLV